MKLALAGDGDSGNAHELSPRARRYGLLVTALAPVIPQLLGSAFNIWYNAIVIEPLLVTAALRRRFAFTVVVYNDLVYPIAIALWSWIILSLRPALRALMHHDAIAPDVLDRSRSRVINLPWMGAAISTAAWLGCVPVFLGALLTTGDPVHAQLLWHLPISFLLSAFIAVTQTFFLIEIASHWGLFLLFFRDTRPDRVAGAHPPSLRARGLMWAVSTGACPIASLLLLMFAPPSAHPQWFAVFVGTVGIAFGLISAVMLTRLVAEPVDELRRAFHKVGRGNLHVHLPLRRADEFGALVSDFNQMAAELRDKERLRRAFGLHVGEKVAQEILAGNPELGGREQIVTVMFVDIRGFTARAAQSQPGTVVQFLNRFLRAMVAVVESEHGGIVNKFLGDGFMAIFGLTAGTDSHADEAVSAARSMLRRMTELSDEMNAGSAQPLRNRDRHQHRTRRSREHRFTRADGIHRHREYRQRCLAGGKSKQNAGHVIAGERGNARSIARFRRTPRATPPVHQRNRGRGARIYIARVLPRHANRSEIIQNKTQKIATAPP